MVASVNHEGPPYRSIDPAPLVALCRTALSELDAILPIDVVVPCAHGAALACLAADGSLALPVMDYTAEPPADIIADYREDRAAVRGGFRPAAAHGAHPRPAALLAAAGISCRHLRRIRTVVPWIQYVAYLLSGKLVTEISGMSCQSQLMNVRTTRCRHWLTARAGTGCFHPLPKRGTSSATCEPEFRGANFRGEGRVLAGVHDSNANYLRYLAAGRRNSLCFPPAPGSSALIREARVETLNREKDMVSNTDVFGKLVACCRFFGGKEFEVLGAGASGDVASLRPCRS